MEKIGCTEFRLKDGHTWRSKPGFKIFVVDGGALRFDVPQDWVIEFGEKSVRFYDRQPPEDNCRLEVSMLHHFGIDWSELPLDQLLRSSVRATDETTPDEDVHRLSRPGVEVAWLERHFVDPKERKAAQSQIAIIRGPKAHALVTLDFWTADADRILPAWKELLESVEMDLKVQDPLLGEQRM